MFNKTIITSPGRTIIDHNSTVHEHRAVTDDSVRLLREMEQQAESKTLSVHRLNNNSVDAVWHIREDYLNCKLTGHCRVIINNKTHEFEIELDRGVTTDRHFETMIQNIAKRITGEIISNFFHKSDVLSLFVKKVSQGVESSCESQSTPEQKKEN